MLQYTEAHTCWQDSFNWWLGVRMHEPEVVQVLTWVYASGMMQDDELVLQRLEAAVARGPDPELEALTKCTGCKACGHEGNRKNKIQAHSGIICRIHTALLWAWGNNCIFCAYTIPNIQQGQVARTCSGTSTLYCVQLYVHVCWAAGAC